MKNKVWNVLLHKDSFLLIATLVWLWFTISLLVDLNYDFQKLQPHTGQISDVRITITKIKNKPLYKDTTKELRINLVTEPRYFAISTKGNFDNIIQSLAAGDTVTVYTKEKVLCIFGYGDGQTIAHLVKHPTGDIVIDYNKKQQSNASIVFLPASATIVFLVWYIIKVRQTKQRMPVLRKASLR
jgi:hypothetical protein